VNDREVLPWIWAAVRADPHNLRAYEIGGYWLGKRLGRTREALALLDEGLARNPGAWSLQVVRGNLFLGQPSAADAARAAYGEAWALWRARGTRAGSTPDDRWEGASILLVLGALEERAGRLEQAREYCAEAGRLAEGQPDLEARVAAAARRLAGAPAGAIPASP
jgi:tetratricopeptide (TPR) repeat protein